MPVETPPNEQQAHVHTHEEPPSEEPKKRRGRKPGTSVQSSNDDLERIEGMLRTYATLAIGLASNINQTDALIIAKHTILTPATAPTIVDDHTPNLITATLQLAEHNRKVRTYLAGLAQQSDMLNVAVAGSAIVLGIMANHKLLPPLFTPPGTNVDNPNGKTTAPIVA